MKGILFIVTAPSGAGKSTICDAVLAEMERLKYSISATTRAPRKGEEDGRDYYFLSREKFEGMLAAGKFLEHARVYDYYYGTPREYIEKELEAGSDLILDIDLQGARSVRARNYPAVYIYILPPSLEVLRQRLEGRQTDSPEVIEKRFAQAAREMVGAVEYDYCIVNDDLTTAVEEMKSIIRAERCRVSRRPGLVEKIIAGVT
jgi:guanylate kinase